MDAREIYHKTALLSCPKSWSPGSFQPLGPEEKPSLSEPRDSDALRALFLPDRIHHYHGQREFLRRTISRRAQR